ncbi:MAG: prepilin-type N-terminal cleavage/methylation domain-containing protein [Halieaceae bacterium]|jgi:type II secretion system protein H|nr:prepilin-type N-terminal cleavage/methylation domain-containing protein [Halieaceae bacterium]
MAIIPTPEAPRRQRGFTLLELLLALAVVGMILAIASVSLNSGDRGYRIDGAANQFVDIASYAMSEAELTGIDMGVLIGLDSAGDVTLYSYEWLQRAGNVWRPAPFEQDVFGRRQLPPDVEVILEIEEGDTELLEREASNDETLPPAPQIIFFGSGEAVPGIMTWVDVESGEVLWEFEWDLLGRFEMRRRGIENEDDE